MSARMKGKNRSRHHKHDRFKLPGVAQAGRRILSANRTAPSNDQNPAPAPVAEVPTGAAAEATAAE